jgi:hypothetical protein
MKIISNVGGFMDDKISVTEDYAVRFHSDRAVNCNCGHIKTMEYMRQIGLIAVFASLPWSAFAAAERFPGVQMQLEELSDAAPLADTSSAVSALEPGVVDSFESAAVQEQVLNQSGVFVSESYSLEAVADAENSQDEIVNKELASLEVDDTGILNPVQNPQMASLEVVDTGTLRQVQNQQPAAEVVSTDAEDTVVLQSGMDTSAPNEVGELNTDAARVEDHQAKNYKVLLPLNSVAEKTESMDAVAAETGTGNGQPEDASGGAASEEIIHLPYAVLLAILALMSMIPVARRKG